MTTTQTNESQTITYPTRKSAKIAIIGGGSPYCAGLMKSFAHEARYFQGCHIVLMDINEEGLKLIYTIGSKLLKHAGADITLEYTTDMKAAINGADFVLTSFRTGGMQARQLDEKIPLKYGLIGQETVGPGGFFYALRTVPEVARIAIEMEKTPGPTVSCPISPYCSGIFSSS